MKSIRSILVTGRNGQVGWELARTLAPLGKVIAVDHEEMNLANPAEIRKVISELKPSLIVNPAAYTAVDKAEQEAELAFKINAEAPGIIAEEAKKIGAALIHFSTDYVFDGTARTPYLESAKAAPTGVYGLSKYKGECAVQEVDDAFLIFRTSWVYATRGKNFLLTMLKLAREREELKVVHDQTGSPTWARMLAEATACVVSKGQSNIVDFCRSSKGLYHLTAGGQTTWHEFTVEILNNDPRRSEHVCKRVLPIKSHEYPSPVKRPEYSVLSNEKALKTFGVQMPDWKEQLTLALG